MIWILIKSIQSVYSHLLVEETIPWPVPLKTIGNFNPIFQRGYLTSTWTPCWFRYEQTIPQKIRKKIRFYKVSRRMEACKHTNFRCGDLLVSGSVGSMWLTFFACHGNVGDSLTTIIPQEGLKKRPIFSGVSELGIRGYPEKFPFSSVPASSSLPTSLGSNQLTTFIFTSWSHQ